MPVQFKGLSEYKRNFRWNDSKRSRSSSPDSKQKIAWAGVPSELLGNTREPNFISKKRVPYYRPQVSQSFQWDGNSETSNTFNKPIPNFREQVKLQSSDVNERVIEKSQVSHKECKTPDGPRKPKVPRSWSADCHLHSVLEPTAATNKQLATDAQKTKDNNISCRKNVVDKAVGADIIHTKSQALQKGKKICETEYSSQFRGTQPPKGPRLRKDFEEKALVCEMGSPSPLKLTGSIIKDQRQDVELQGKHLLNEQNPQTTVHSNKRLRNLKSEYKTNFRSPAQYKYEEAECRSEGGTEINLISSWYAEVKELREKAEAYKRRARGTHFSRDHLTQILSEQNKLWDVSSTSDSEEEVSESVKALDLARARSTHISSMQKKSESTRQNAMSSPKARTKYSGISDVPTLPVSRKLAWNDEEEKPHEAGGDQVQICETKNVVEGNADVEAVMEREVAPVNAEDEVTGKSDSNGQSEFGSDAGGRLPIPKLKTIDRALRTHHDLTTPAIGGAVLVAPRQVRSPSPVRRRSQPPLGKAYSPYKYLSESPGRISKKTELLRHSPAAGVETCDPIPLREEYMSGDYSSPSHVKSVPSIQALLKSLPASDQNSSVTTSPSRSFPHRIQGTLRHPEFQHNGNTGGPRTGLLRLQLTDAAGADNEDDRMSQISARSAASSSLASQVLERAQKRRDNFWGKNL
ncbi:nuclear protein MDM1 isoform X3 [Amblyraja radiata]|uniref:nuclear protein MDM1 isoform X3 n=1 Tax=Amblyraja radiata TaxID=386614 RepID=UPI001402518E|nr:nuclear protein MDM1 isoform X3 [Amblyraja radiata]